MAKPRKENVSEKERRYLDHHKKAQQNYMKRKYHARLHALVLDVFELEMKGLTATEIAEELNNKWFVRSRQ